MVDYRIKFLISNHLESDGKVRSKVYIFQTCLKQPRLKPRLRVTTKFFFLFSINHRGFFIFCVIYFRSKRGFSPGSCGCASDRWWNMFSKPVGPFPVTDHHTLKQVVLSVNHITICMHVIILFSQNHSRSSLIFIEHYSTISFIYQLPKYRMIEIRFGEKIWHPWLRLKNKNDKKKLFWLINMAIKFIKSITKFSSREKWMCNVWTVAETTKWHKVQSIHN